MPCSVRMPSAQCSDSVTPSRPIVSKPCDASYGGADLEAGGEDEAVELVLDARRPTTPVSSIRSTPLPSVSTRCTSGLLYAWQVLVVEARPLAQLAVPGLERLGGGRVLDDLVDAARGSPPSSRRRCPRTAAMMSSGVNSSGGNGDDAVADAAARCRSSRPAPGPRRRSPPRLVWREVLEPLAAASPARASANHSGSVGWLLRTSIDDGVRWNTYSSPAARARCGMHCTAVAPVPMMPTRLSASSSSARRSGRRRCSRSPTGWCGSVCPANVSMPGMPGQLRHGAAGRCPSPTNCARELVAAVRCG